ncbi:Sulfite exporter TauE/SafE family protein 3 [Glycine max]|nr:Sulfite exporter TauE/SafE family protein 3 [Glycine max]
MRHVVIFSFNFLLLCVFISAITSTKSEVSSTNEEQSFSYHIKALEFIWKHLGYQHVWPEMEFSWRIVVGTLIGILGAAFGSVGGVGGGGIFVPMLILIIGFDPKSAVAISKCKHFSISVSIFCPEMMLTLLIIGFPGKKLLVDKLVRACFGKYTGVISGMVTGAAISAVFFCMKQRHPTLDEPVIDYDLMLLIQPTLMLGISIGVILSVIFADWMVTILLIILCIVTSIRAFFMGADTWKKETKMKEESQETIKLSESTATCSEEEGYKYLPGCSDEGYEKDTRKPEIPITVGFYLYQARALYQGRAAGSQHTHWPLHHLFLASICSLLAGIVGGLLGTGSGFVMGPLFLEVGIAPQVASATATFGMMYSSSLSVIQYYLLNRFPVPYALFLTLVAAIAAFLGQYLIDKLVNIFQRASLIIFVLAFTIFVSSIALGGVGISNMILKIQRNEYMGFDNFCRNDT